jgi:hypothetical protein
VTWALQGARKSTLYAQRCTIIRDSNHANTESKYWLQNSCKIPVEINLYAMREKVNHESSICTLQKKHGDLQGELWSILCRSIGGTEARILI